MTSAETEKRRKRIEEILADLLADDVHGNKVQYVWASDIADEDSELSATMVGSYLPDLEAESPLSNGLIVERYTEKRGGASLWKIQMESESNE